MAKEYMLTVTFRDYSNSLDDNEIWDRVSNEIVKIIRDKWMKTSLSESFVSVSGKYTKTSSKLAARNDCFTILRHELRYAGFIDDTASNILRFALLLDLIQSYKTRQSFEKLCLTQKMMTDEVEESLSTIVKVLNVDKSVIKKINQMFPNSANCTPKRFTAYRLVKFICEWANISLNSREGK